MSALAELNGVEQEFPAFMYPLGTVVLLDQIVQVSREVGKADLVMLGCGLHPSRTGVALGNPSGKWTSTAAFPLVFDVDNLSVLPSPEPVLGPVYFNAAFGEIGNRTSSAGALRSVGMVCRLKWPGSGICPLSVGIFYGRFILWQGQAAIAAILGGAVPRYGRDPWTFSKCSLYGRASFRYSCGGFGSSSYGLRPLTGNRTVAAILWVFVIGMALPEFGILGTKTGDYGFQGIQTEHKRFYKFPTGQIFTFPERFEVDRYDPNL